jgi:hypothetical protein
VDRSLRLAEKDAASNDPRALTKLLASKRRVGQNSFDITRLFTKFIEFCAAGHQTIGSWHDRDDSFRTRLFYGGNLAFTYKEGVLVVTGCYLPGFRYRQFINRLDENLYHKFTNLSELPMPIRETIRRNDGETYGIIINTIEDADCFVKIKSIIEEFLL